VDDAARVEHDDVAREPLHERHVLLDEEDRRELGGALESCGDLGDEERSEALRRLVDEEHPVPVEERARDRDHLLLPTGERPSPLPGALSKLWEEVVHEVVPGLVVALGEPEVLLDGQPGEHVAILGDVADPRRTTRVSEARDVPPTSVTHPASARAHQERSVVVFPTPFPEERGDPVLGDVERDPLQDVRLAEVDVEVLDGERDAHRGSPRYAVWTVSSAITRSGVSNARSAPWCMTAIRCASPTTTSMRCSTISTVRPSSVCTDRITSMSPSTSSTETPAIGSSSRITRGSPARSIAS
jgi:hypothetical protein